MSQRGDELPNEFPEGFGAGLRLGNSVGWEVFPPLDAKEFIRGLPALLPADCNLCLEVTSGCLAADVRSFLLVRPASHVRRILPETLSPDDWTLFFHIPTDAETIEGLARLFSNHAQPEICDHFYAYSPAGMMLEWHDSFYDSPFYLSKLLPEETVAIFSDAIGCIYERYTEDY